MIKSPFIHLGIALGFLVISLIGYGAMYASVERVSAEAAVLKESVETKGQDAARIGMARTALVSLVEDEATIDSYFVAKEDIVTFLEELEASGRAVGADVEVASVGVETVGDREQVAVSLRVEGSFDAVMRTLGTIEYGSYDGVVTSMTLDTPARTSSGSKLWTGIVSLTIGAKETSS
jgi:hypothetical protein